MRDEDKRVVREISFFSTMSDEHFDNLFKMAYLQSLPEQVQLVREGDRAEFLHVVVEGTIELYGSSNDRETTMFLLRPVTTFNLSAVLNDTVYLMSARTLAKAKVLMIPAENVRKLMEIDLIFAREMVAELSKRYRMVIKTSKEQKLRTGVERLANYLLRLNEQTGGSGHFVLTEDKRTLAGLLGMIPEYLSRALSTLKKNGVKVRGSKISLTNMDDLNDLAKPNPLIDHPSI